MIVFQKLKRLRMFFPLKMKWSNKKQTVLLNLHNEDEDKRISSLNLIRIGKVFKTTSFNRFPKTISFLMTQKRKFSSVHDIGCSDGTASICVIKNIRFGKYYCMDKFLEMKLIESGASCFLLDDNENVHMYENKFFFLYLDPFDVQSSIFEKIFTWIFFKLKNVGGHCQKIRLVNPILERSRNIVFKNFDIFEDNLEAKSDLILIFNLLNKFNNDRRLKKVKKFLLDNLNDGGLAIIGENETTEKATCYKMQGDLTAIKRLNGGSKVNLL